MKSITRTLTLVKQTREGLAPDYLTFYDAANGQPGLCPQFVSRMMGGKKPRKIRVTVSKNERKNAKPIYLFDSYGSWGFTKKSEVTTRKLRNMASFARGTIRKLMDTDVKPITSPTPVYVQIVKI